MSPRTPLAIIDGLLARERSGALRRVREFGAGVDLSSNDYLGLARRLATPESLERVCNSLDGQLLGATGSRLVTGSHAAHTALEEFLADFHNSETSLLFGSGYEANLGVLSSLGSRSDTILYDEYAHASMRDGVRLSLARSYSFRHNDLEDLRNKIASARGDCYIVVESLYSMDGDFAPLVELCHLAEESGAFIIVDEAHATGLYGDKGRGLVSHHGVEERVFARIHTFGKALGFRGACVLGPRALREHLINSARPFIYSTAPDTVSLAFIREAYGLMAAADRERVAVHMLIAQCTKLCKATPDLTFSPSTSPIQGVIVPGNEIALAIERSLLRAGYFARAIRAPTVPLGSERVRLCIHAHNSLDQIMGALSVIVASLKDRGIHS